MNPDSATLRGDHLDRSSDPDGTNRRKGLLSPTGWAVIGFLAISAFYLLSEHRAQFLGALPWLLLLACPFLHILHGGHDHAVTAQMVPPTREADHEP